MILGGSYDDVDDILIQTPKKFGNKYRNHIKKFFSVMHANNAIFPHMLQGHCGAGFGKG